MIRSYIIFLYIIFQRRISLISYIPQCLIVLIFEKKEKKNLVRLCNGLPCSIGNIKLRFVRAKLSLPLSLLYIIWTIEKARNLRRLLDTWRVKAAAARDKRMSSLATRPLRANAGRLFIMRRPPFLSFSPSADLIANLIYYHEWNCPSPFFRAIRENGKRAVIVAWSTNFFDKSTKETLSSPLLKKRPHSNP